MPLNDYGGHVYVLVRSDLPPAQRAVQAAHALLEASRGGIVPHDKPHPHLVICGVRGTPRLLDAGERLRSAGIRFRVFAEPDLGNAPTALATEPVDGDKRAYFRKFQLLKE